MDAVSKAYYVSELWSRFKQKIEEDWDEKYSHYGKSFEQAQGQINFAIAIQNDIEKKLTKKNTLTKVIGQHTIHRMVLADSISVNTKDSTLECLSEYLGYQSWGNFQQIIEKNKENKLLVIDHEKVITEGNTKPKTAPNRRNKKIIITALLSIPFICALILIYRNETLANSSERISFESIINKANAKQFSCLRSLPKVDTSGLRQYYTKDGVALKNLIGFLKNRRKTGRTLVENESYFVIKTLKIIKKDDKETHILTKEHWYLLWCDPNDPKGWLYDVNNEQEYILKMENGKWKIDYNHYEGTTKKPAVPPVCN